GTLAVPGTINGGGIITEDGSGGTTISPGTLNISNADLLAAPITLTGAGLLNSGSLVLASTGDWSIGSTLAVGNPSAFGSLVDSGELTLHRSSSDLVLISSNAIADGASLTVANNSGLVSVPASVTASAVPTI